MDEEELKNVKLMLRSVLISAKDGVSATVVQRDYKDIVGDNIPYRKFGFQTFEQFITSIPDVARLERRGGDVIIHGLADESTSHIKALVSKQRSKKVKKPIRRRRGGGSSTARFPTRPAGPRPQGPNRRAYPGTPGQHGSRHGIPSFISPPMGKPLTPFTVSIDNASSSSRTVRIGPNPLLNKAMAEANKDSVTIRPQQQSPRFEVPPRFRKRIGGMSPPQQQQQSQIQTTPVRRPPQSKMATMENGDVYIVALSKHLQEINQPLQFETSKMAGGFVSSININKNIFGSEDIFRTAREAEAAAAKTAVTQLNLNKKQDSGTSLPPIDWNDTGTYNPVLNWADEMSREETGGSSLPREQLLKIKSRIKEIIQNKKNGLWGTRIPIEYKERYNEDPPEELMDLIKTWKDVARVEPVINTDRELVYPVTEDPNMKLEIPRDLQISGEDPVTVYMSYLQSPGYFCLQREDSVIDSITESLQTHCKSVSCPLASELKKGRYCAALFSGDGCWTRAEILQHKEDGTVDVLFVDYGNVETVKEKEVKWLSPDLAKYPSQAISCSLFGIEPLQGETGWSDAASTLFADQVHEEPLIAIPQNFCDNLVEVLLYLKSDTSISVNDKLIQAGVAKDIKVEVEDESLHPADLELPEEKEWDVHVTYISSSTESVMLRLIGEQFSDKLETYQNKLQEAFRNSSAETPVKEGMTYIAYDDGLYHRVRVISQDDKKVMCYFLDHGDTDELIPEQLHPIDPQINKLLPYQAVEVCLYGLEDVSTNITALEKICDLALGKTCVAEVIERDDLPSVILYDTSGDNDININETILRTIEAEGGGISTPKTESPSPSNSATSTPQRVLSPVPGDVKSSSAIGDYKTKKLDNNANPVIGSVSADTYEQFAGVGPSITAEISTKKLLSNQQLLPNLSQLSVNSDTSANSELSMKSKSSELPENVPNVSRPILGRSTSGKDSVQELASDNDEPKPFQIPPVGEYLEVHVNFVNDPSNFVCIPYGEMNNLNQLLLDMLAFYKEHVQSMSQSDVQPGKLYAGYKDDIWYRVKVSNIVGSDLVSVYLVDIGEYSVMMLSEIQPLAPQFRKLPFMAFNATLGSIVPESGTWYEAAKYKFIELAREKDLIGLIQGQDEKTGFVDLRLIDTSEDTVDLCIDELLVKLQYATFK